MENYKDNDQTKLEAIQSHEMYPTYCNFVKRGADTYQGHISMAVHHFKNSAEKFHKYLSLLDKIYEP